MQINWQNPEPLGSRDASQLQSRPKSGTLCKICSEKSNIKLLFLSSLERSKLLCQIHTNLVVIANICYSII